MIVCDWACISSRVLLHRRWSAGSIKVSVQKRGCSNATIDRRYWINDCFLWPGLGWLDLPDSVRESSWRVCTRAVRTIPAIGRSYLSNYNFTGKIYECVHLCENQWKKNVILPFHLLHERGNWWRWNVSFGFLLQWRTADDGPAFGQFTFSRLVDPVV